MNNKINSIVRVPTLLDVSFFRLWLKFLSPLHNLTDKEINIVAVFLKHRFLLSKSIKDSSVLDEVLMSKDYKKKIKEECGITTTYFQMLMTRLKKKGAIVNNNINPKFIPKNISEDSKFFQLLLHFDFSGKK